MCDKNDPQGRGQSPDEEMASIDRVLVEFEKRLKDWAANGANDASTPVKTGRKNRGTVVYDSTGLHGY